MQEGDSSTCEPFASAVNNQGSNCCVPLAGSAHPAGLPDRCCSAFKAWNVNQRPTWDSLRGGFNSLTDRENLLIFQSFRRHPIVSQFAFEIGCGKNNGLMPVHGKDDIKSIKATIE
jgi:hypothetical protein